MAKTTKQKTLQEMQAELDQLEIEMQKVFQWRPGDPPIELKKRDIAEETNDYEL